MKVSDKIKKFFRRPIKLTNSQKVEVAHQRIQASLSMFSKINEEIEEVNKSLEEVILQDTETLKKVKQNREKASDELSMNKALQEKLEAFIIK